MKAETIIAMSVQQLVCTGCGSEANATCSCGKPYVPKKQRAADAVKANPRKSNVAIAEELGVSDETVRRAREELGSTYVEGEREGRDGKVYHFPVREVVEDEDSDEDDMWAEPEPDEPDNRRAAFLLYADHARLVATYPGPVDADVLGMARAAADAWQKLVSALERKARGGREP